MIEVVKAAAELQALCESKGWKFCFIGGVALQRWGRPRETIDADITLLAGFGREEEFVAELSRRFEPRFADARQFALERRVLLLRSGSGVGLDIALGALPFEESMIARSSKFLFPSDTWLRTCSAEDLVVMKAFAGRGQDWVDLDGILIRQSGKLDWEYIVRQLRPLAELKDAPEIVERLVNRRDELAQ